jgi:Uma2 family endonuclease
LTPQLKRRSCSAHSSDLRVKVRATGLQTYPDIVVICGQPQFEDHHRDTVLNPVAVFEILSRTTEAYDRGAKFVHYRRLESLTDYVLISQNSPMLEHYARQPDGRWMLSTYQGLEAVAVIPSIGCELPLSEIYDQVEWTEDDAAITMLHLVRDPAARYESEGGVYADHPGPPDLNR